MFNKHLEELDLSGCMLGDEGAAVATIALVHHPKLSTLNLCRNQLSLETLSSVTRVLSSAKSKLRTLDLSYNPDLMQTPSNSLDNLTKQRKTRQDFAHALQHHQCLKHLILSFCDISGDNAALFQALQRTDQSVCSIQKLDLICTRLGKAGYHVLLQSIDKMDIQELGIDWSFPSLRREQFVHSIMAKNTSICRVFQSPHSASNQNDGLQKCIQKNRALKRINANPDRPPSFWIQVLADLGKSSGHFLEGIKDAGRVNKPSTLVYQVVRQLLPHNAEVFTDWVTLSHHSNWEED